MESHWVYVLIKDMIYVIIWVTAIGTLIDISTALQSAAITFESLVLSYRENVDITKVLLNQDKEQPKQ